MNIFFGNRIKQANLFSNAFFIHQQDELPTETKMAGLSYDPKIFKI
jgi:hypothetical protein